MERADESEVEKRMALRQVILGKKIGDLNKELEAVEAKT